MISGLAINKVIQQEKEQQQLPPLLALHFVHDSGELQLIVVLVLLPPLVLEEQQLATVLLEMKLKSRERNGTLRLTALPLHLPPNTLAKVSRSAAFWRMPSQLAMFRL